MTQHRARARASLPCRYDLQLFYLLKTFFAYRYDLQLPSHEHMRRQIEPLFAPYLQGM